jgi:threonine dehydrogenase-like Zn-dependent dehydrogenase
MIAAVLSKPKTFELLDVDTPSVGEEEIKIKVEGCGICASSIPLWEGREWFTYPVEPGSPGHEGWGIVEDTGPSVYGISKGDRVAFLSYHAYAEYDKAHFQSAVVLPPSLAGQPFPGEPLGCAMNIFERSSISPSDTVAIIGSGFLGVLLCQLCKNAGATVIVVSKRNFSLHMAKINGADHIVPLNNSWDVMNNVSDITQKSMCTRVIEATGKQEGLDVATEIVSEGGRIIIAGYHQDGLRQVNVQKWNWKGIDVINAHERQNRRYVQGMEKAVKALSEGRIDPSALYTDVLSLEELERGFEMTVNRPDGFMKALIEMK